MNKIKLIFFLIKNDISYQLYNKILNNFYEYKVMYVNNLLSYKTSNIVKFILKKEFFNN